jgi:hypothetical protein
VGYSYGRVSECQFNGCCVPPLCMRVDSSSDGLMDVILRYYYADPPSTLFYSFHHQLRAGLHTFTLTKKYLDHHPRPPYSGLLDVRSANPVHCWATKPSNLCDYVTPLTHVAGWLRSLPTPQVRTGAPSRASQPHTHQTHHNTTNHLHGSLGSKRNELMTTHTRHT